MVSRLGGKLAGKVAQGAIDTRLATSGQDLDMSLASAGLQGMTKS